MTKAKLIAFPTNERMKQQPSKVLFQSVYRTLKFSVEVPEFFPARILDLLGHAITTDMGYVVELDIQIFEEVEELCAFLYVEEEALPTIQVHEMSKHIADNLDSALKAALCGQ